MEKVNSKILVLIGAVVLVAVGLGLSLEGVFAAGFQFDSSAWTRLVPVVLAFVVTVSLMTVLSLVGRTAERGLGFALAAAGFGLPFLVSPNPILIPILFTLLLPTTFFGGTLLLDYHVRSAVKSSAVFSSSLFSTAYARFFLFFVFALGVLVYFSAQPAPQERFKIPENMLNPALNLIVNRVMEQVQGQLGTQTFTEEQFLAELKRSGLLQALERQFGVSLTPEKIRSPEDLTESLREPLVAQLTQDLEDLLGPYLPFLPLVAAVGAGLSLLFLGPVFVYLSRGAFALTYRVLVWLHFAYWAEETRTVKVFKV